MYILLFNLQEPNTSRRYSKTFSTFSPTKQPLRPSRVYSVDYYSRLFLLNEVVKTIQLSNLFLPNNQIFKQLKKYFSKSIVKVQKYVPQHRKYGLLKFKVTLSPYSTPRPTSQTSTKPFTLHSIFLIFFKNNTNNI